MFPPAGKSARSPGIRSTSRSAADPPIRTAFWKENAGSVRHRVHVGSNELYRYGFGGATATSTIAIPDFTLTGVAPGIHDLTVWGLNTPSGTRGLIRRDLDIPSGGSLGEVSVLAPEGFAPATATMTISGGGTISPVEQVTAAMSLITRESCTINPLYSTPVTAPTTPFAISGVPGTHRRALDLQLLSLIATRPNTVRTTHVMFRDLTNKTIAMGLSANDPVVNRLDGAYARLEVAATASLLSYDRTVQLEYDGSGKRVSILASRAYFNNAANVVITTPDFLGAPGWQNSFAPPADATGSWTMTFSGGLAQPWCEPGLSYTMVKNGTY